ncbi:hypothetical protein HMPREF1326_01518 [Akkermansia sp. KLE1605]|nr:hypothetical protein HMPREF1326_01518 [Akkermansia sp. KLE1605]
MFFPDFDLSSAWTLRKASEKIKAFNGLKAWMLFYRNGPFPI